MTEFTPRLSAFEENWPVSPDLADHQAYAREGLNVINNALILPADGRWDVAYGALAQAGPDSAVAAEGEPGTGKTDFGNIVLGQQSRVDVQATDTIETLQGYARPTDGQWNEGSLRLNEEDLRIFLNEISHLRDTGPLHKYWDGADLIVNGRNFSLANAPMYLTTNFADGGRVKKLDSALRSRIGLMLLAGDAPDSTISARIQSRDLGMAKTAEDAAGGLLPPAKTREQIRGELQRQNPLARDAGDYMVRVVSKMNESGLFVPVNPNEARIGRGWQQVVRAQRLVDGGRSGEIQSADLAKVAALALGSVAVLSQHGSAEFQDRLGRIGALSQLDKAVIARRLTAMVAMDSYLDTFDSPNVSEEKLERDLNRYSYANTGEADVINDAVLDLIIRDTASKTKAEESNGQPRSRFGLRTRK